MIRELRVTDIRCHAEGCGAGPGESCGGLPAHRARIDEHAELVAAGWHWQEVDLDDKGAADKRRERCAKRPRCTETAGHGGNCAEVPRYDFNRSEPKRGGR